MYRIEYRETCKYTHRGEILINDLPVGVGTMRQCHDLINELLEDPEYPSKTKCVYNIWLDILAEQGKVSRIRRTTNG